MGLLEASNTFNLLTIAHSLYSSRFFQIPSTCYISFENILECGSRLIRDYPEEWKGYHLTAKDYLLANNPLMSLKILEKGLSVEPEEINLLILQCEVYRSTGEREKSFKAGMKILNKYPKKWEGYALASQDLAIMKDFAKAESILEKVSKKQHKKIN